MKKFLTTLLVLSVLFLGFVFLFDPAGFYEPVVEQGNLYFSPHKIFNSCIVSHGAWEGENETMVMEIPDEVNGKRVTIWGNHFPDPFIINMEGVGWYCGEEMVPEGAVIVPRYLTIHIGKNLTELRDFDTKVFYSDNLDPSVYYQILVDIQCAEDNPHFYSDNGKLYRKAGGLLVDVFFYVSDYQ